MTPLACVWNDLLVNLHSFCSLFKYHALYDLYVCHVTVFVTYSFKSWLTLNLPIEV